MTQVVVLRLHRVRLVIQDDVGRIEVDAAASEGEEGALVRDFLTKWCVVGAIAARVTIRIRDRFGRFVRENVVSRVN